MRRYSFVLALLMVCCGCSNPPIIVNPPEPTPPGPVTPPEPIPDTPTSGTITETQYGVILEGQTEEILVASLGPPFRKSESAGFTVYVYAFPNSSSVAWFFVKDGKIDRKSRL
jgi:hypothetical protein